MNLVYLVVRFRNDLPLELKNAKEAIESVLPDVKNIDKYGELIYHKVISYNNYTRNVRVVVSLPEDKSAHSIITLLVCTTAYSIVLKPLAEIVVVPSLVQTVALSGIKQYASQLAINLDLKKRGVADNRYVTTVALAYPREDVMPQPRLVPTRGLGRPPPDAPYPVDNWIKY
ncbi:unnamed protein product [Ixodes persulcatus]